MGDTGDFYDYPRLETTDPRYQIPGINGFSLSKWARENVMQEGPRYQVGDWVVLTIVGQVTHVSSDCDGTPLFEIDEKYRGWSVDSLRPATPDEIDEW
jgi:hypothetical protein